LSQEVEDIFREAGAILEGHFELTSGLHSPVYWEKFRVLSSPHHTERLCKMIAQNFEGTTVEVVAGPTLGGIIIAFEVARQLGIRSIYAERDGARREFRRGLSINRGERVLVVDDVLTTGTSTLEVIKAVKRHGGEIAGVGVLVDRSSGGVPDLEGYPVFSCHQVSTTTYAPDKCPLCAQDIPLIKLGSSQTRPSP
jgi:orotate phosphoribosyltransferase